MTGLSMRSRTYSFVAYGMILALLFQRDVGALVNLSLNDNRYTHILAVPIITAALMYLERKRIFRDVRYGVWAGLLLTAPAALLYGVVKGRPDDLGQYGILTVSAAAIVLSWVAGFVFFYGVRCGKAALFSLALLLLAIPISPAVVEVAEVTLQKGSAEVAYLIFQLSSTPVFREGLVFSLPGLTIEVARECSGIRSGISLLITALVLGHLFLRSGWTKACLLLLIVPIAIVKNAVRIALLSMLGVYVSHDYLHGNVHHRGGPLFSILSLALLFAALWLLRKREDHVRTKHLGGGPTVLLDEGPEAQARPAG